MAVEFTSTTPKSPKQYTYGDSGKGIGELGELSRNLVGIGQTPLPDDKESYLVTISNKNGEPKFTPERKTLFGWVRQFLTNLFGGAPLPGVEHPSGTTSASDSPKVVVPEA